MLVNYKKTSVSIIIITILMFILSTVWNLYLVDFFIPEPIPNLRPEMLHSSILIGYLLLSILMGIAYQFYTVDLPILKKGISFGIFIALIWIVPANIILHGVFIVPDFTLYIDISWGLVEQGLGGLTMAYIMDSEIKILA
ncbi:MAG: hypothetical protein HeimC3_21990 [Candidatus Heimdallarchaeota archaeon LC_3]|nr:MAG: hypothetical protein HeimC3_21990 [Candidatus Heimdallarchaeota archaeon LC_3]